MSSLRGIPSYMYKRGRTCVRPSTKRRRSFAKRRRYFCLIYGSGLAFLVLGVFYVIFEVGPYRGKPKWRRRGYRRATHTPTAAPTPPSKQNRRGRRDGVS